MRGVSKPAVLGVAVTLVALITGCGGSGSSEPESTLSSVHEQRRVDTEDWPAVTEPVGTAQLDELADTDIPQANECEYGFEVEHGTELTSLCGTGNSVALEATENSEPVARCSGSEADGFNCHAELEYLDVTVFAWRMDRGEALMRAAVSQVAELQEGEEPGVEQSSGESLAEDQAQVAGVASTEAGDKVSVKVTAGPAEPMTEVGDSFVNVCRQQISEIGSSPQRTLAVPVSITVTILSSPAPDLEVSLSEVGPVEGPEGDVTIEEVIPVWAENFSEGPECEVEYETGGHVHWGIGELSPGEESTWDGYMLFTEAITPNNSGEELGETLVFEPLVDLAGALAPIKYEHATSPSLVHCSLSTGIYGRAPLIALNQAVALERGCLD
jgi:hypothetical protein